MKIFTVLALPFLLLLAGCPQATTGYQGFHRSLNDTPHGYAVVQAPVRTGTAERFEVRDGDCNSQPDWNDCTSDRDRSELSEDNGRDDQISNYGGTYWYSWSIFIPKDFQDVDPANIILGQFKQRNVLNAALIFKMYFGTYMLKVAPGETSEIDISPEGAKGKWLDVIIHTKWTTENDGFTKVWVNGFQEADHTGPTTFNNNDIYFKYGIYRSRISGYTKAKGKLPTHVVYYNNIRRGKKRSDVEFK
jgi:hypothetical protein